MEGNKRQETQGGKEWFFYNLPESIFKCTNIHAHTHVHTHAHTLSHAHTASLLGDIFPKNYENYSAFERPYAQDTHAHTHTHTHTYTHSLTHAVYLFWDIIQKGMRIIFAFLRPYAQAQMFLRIKVKKKETRLFWNKIHNINETNFAFYFTEAIHSSSDLFNPDICIYLLIFWISKIVVNSKEHDLFNLKKTTRRTGMLCKLPTSPGLFLQKSPTQTEEGKKGDGESRSL